MHEQLHACTVAGRGDAHGAVSEKRDDAVFHFVNRIAGNNRYEESFSFGFQQNYRP